MIRCAHCGSPITGETKTKKTKNGDKQYVYYRCTRYHLGDHPRMAEAPDNCPEWNWRLTENNLRALIALAGRWAGDRVSLVGDYDSSKLWHELYKRKAYRNISKELVDEWIDFIEIDTMKLKFKPCRSCQPNKQ
jgi:hypothetical protein